MYIALAYRTRMYTSQAMVADTDDPDEETCCLKELVMSFREAL